MKIIEDKFKVIIKTGCNKNEFLEFDNEKEAYRINLKAKPINGEANKELIKFLSKELKRMVVIKSGFCNKVKIIELI